MNNANDLQKYIIIDMAEYLDNRMLGVMQVYGFCVRNNANDLDKYIITNMAEHLDKRMLGVH